ncbi:hypothetical protein BH23CHL8_BH23CHL8_15740 [soil metagenome]
MRLDRALLADTRTALRSPFIVAFLLLEAGAGALFVARRGEGAADTVVLIWLGMLFTAFLAWWAGRHRLARPQPDPVTGAPGRSLFALLGASGMLLVGFGINATLGVVLVLGGIGGWAYVALRTGGFGGLLERLTRDPRPFIPLLLLLALPRLLFGGPLAFVGVVLALPSGIGQQLLYLLGLFSPLEALRGRTDMAAVTAALVFGAVHVPLNVPANGGDVLAALANAVLFQSSVGLIACLAVARHRAVLPLGVAHALAIG